MKSKIDLRSVLIGICVGVTAMLAIGASSSQPSTVGRYQIGATGTQGLVIDTATGQVWSKYFNPNGGISDNDFAKPKLDEKR